MSDVSVGRVERAWSGSGRRCKQPSPGPGLAPRRAGARSLTPAYDSTKSAMTFERQPSDAPELIGPPQVGALERFNGIYQVVSGSPTYWNIQRDVYGAEFRGNRPLQRGATCIGSLRRLPFALAKRWSTWAAVRVGRACGWPARPARCLLASTARPSGSHRRLNA
jgi:hypothetical protein